MENRRFGNRRSNGPARIVPVKEGETYDITIDALGEKGDGIGRIQGFVIIVPGVTQGQQVKVKINAVRGKVSFGEVVGVGTATASTETTESSGSETVSAESVDSSDEESENSEESVDSEESSEEVE